MISSTFLEKPEKVMRALDAVKKKRHLIT